MPGAALKEEHYSKDQANERTKDKDGVPKPEGTT
jgi:hypothetical protein